jgi:NAD(P)-dependent dehydrogenase (short-subunit alcohol dehydrogenase family)
VVRVAVVTGAARGIGAATCAALRADGFEVLGLDLAGVELAADVTDPARSPPRSRASRASTCW